MKDVRRLVTRSKALLLAADLAHTHAGDPASTVGRQTARRVGRRIAFGHDRTVVGILGPTGVGKSSLFNHLVGQTASPVSLIRPTTDRAHAHVFGAPAHQLLDWFGVTSRTAGAGGEEWQSVVLLDMPDVDSFDRRNRHTVRRLVEHLDVLLWVVDPEKYADAEVYEQFLDPLGEYGLATLVVVNKADAVPARDQEVITTAIRQRLIETWGSDSPVCTDPILVSASTGFGTAQLRRQVAALSADRQVVLRPLSRDLCAAATQLQPAEWTPSTDADAADVAIANLTTHLGLDAAMATGTQVEESVQRRVTAWPPLRPFLTTDPLAAQVLPERSPEAEADLGQLAVAVAGSDDGPWPTAVRRAIATGADGLAGQVREGVGGQFSTGGSAPSIRALGHLQDLVFGVTVLAGLLYAFVSRGGADTGRGLRNVALPSSDTVLLVALAGLVTGLLLTAVGWLLARTTANRRGRLRVAGVEELVRDAVEESVLRDGEVILRTRRKVRDLTELAASSGTPGE